METAQVITGFIEKAAADPRIGPVHLGLYLSIVYLWLQQGAGSSVAISAKRVKPVAKIGGGGLYHRSMRQLHEYGYIRYEPSYDPEVSSRVWLHRAANDERNASQRC